MSRLNKLFERTRESPEYRRKAARAAVTADLRILIAHAEKSQKEVAEFIGISPAALSAKLSGEKNLTLDSIVDIAAATGAEVDLVFRPVGTKRALQMWEARAKTDSALDRAINILDMVEALHLKQQAMQATLNSMAQMAFRNRKTRHLIQGFKMETSRPNDAHPSGLSAASGF